jgi:hypothetical protein
MPENYHILWYDFKHQHVSTAALSTLGSIGLLLARTGLDSLSLGTEKL